MEHESISEYYEIPEKAMKWFGRKMRALMKKSDKLGMTGAVNYRIAHVDMMEVPLSPDEVPLQDPGEELPKKYVPVNIIEVTGGMPKYEGWEFIATLEHLPGASATVVRTVPGKETPKSYRKADQICEHCNTRRHRKDTYVIRHESGEFKQVGSKCLTDFLGGADAQSIASAAEMGFGMFRRLQKDLEDWEDDFFSNMPQWDTSWHAPSVLALAVAIIRECGFVSRKKHNENHDKHGWSIPATADEIFHQMRPPKPLPKKFRKIVPSDEQKEKAKAVVDWLKGMEHPASEYLHNLKTIVEAEYVGYKELGFLASAVIAFDREHDLLKEREARPESQFVGEIKKRDNYHLTIDKVITLPDYGYGESFMFVMHDADWNVFLWKASSWPCQWTEEAVFDPDEGTFWELRGTVKAHEVYKGRSGNAKAIRQTVLTRCEVISMTNAIERVEENRP